MTLVVPALLAGCGQQAEGQNAAAGGSGGGAAGQAAPPQKADVKKLAASLSTKTDALVEAIKAKNDARINSAKAELQREADRAEDAVKSETGPAANQLNAAVTQIRTAVLSNDVARLERAKELLQQAAK